MKYCSNCGKQLTEKDYKCPNCGKQLNPYIKDTQQLTFEEKKQLIKKNKHSFLLIALILAIISTITTGILIIPLMWTIPMTLKIKNAYQHDMEEFSMGFIVCSIIFLNLIIGIILLICNKAEE